MALSAARFAEEASNTTGSLTTVDSGGPRGTVGSGGGPGSGSCAGYGGTAVLGGTAGAECAGAVS